MTEAPAPRPCVGLACEIGDHSQCALAPESFCTCSCHPYTVHPRTDYSRHLADAELRTHVEWILANPEAVSTSGQIREQLQAGLERTLRADIPRPETALPDKP